jgi:acyl-CoA thioester hydrolase
MSKKNITIHKIVHYHQVDQMGVMHHAQYVYALEQSRIEWLLNQGVSYGDLEKKGILLPVVDINIQYKKPLHFEDAYFVHATLNELNGYYVDFSYVIENQEKKSIASATTRLVFVDAQSRRAMKCPDFLLKVFHSQ